MNKTQYLKKLDELELDKKEYCIISGGIMVMYGLRDETADIDLRITPELFRELSKRYELKDSNKFPDLYELGDDIELAVCTTSCNDIAYIDGYPVYSIEKQLEWKEKNNRPKDKEDIRLIKEYLNKK